ncbi:MAG: hypothetical protein WCC41_17355, partial [Rhodomicrobium sp.]
AGSIGLAKSWHIRGEAAGEPSYALKKVFPIAREAGITMHEDHGVFAAGRTALQHWRTNAVYCALS